MSDDFKESIRSPIQNRIIGNEESKKQKLDKFLHQLSIISILENSTLNPQKSKMKYESQQKLSPLSKINKFKRNSLDPIIPVAFQPDSLIKNTIISVIRNSILTITVKLPNGTNKTIINTFSPNREVLGISSFSRSFKIFDKGEFYELFPMRWIRGQVFFELSPKFQSRENKKLSQILKDCMEDLNKRTYVKFIEKKKEVDDFVFFDIDDEISVFIGRYPGKNEVKISSKSTSGHIYHNLMHILGFVHETKPSNSRPLGYYSINNIPPYCREGVEMVKFTCEDTLGPYDEDSVIHSNACIGQTQDPLRKLRFKEKPSKLDIMKINFFYGNRHCTFDYYKIPYFQTHFNCIDCWGTSKFPICMFCKEFHHKGHQLIKVDYSVSPSVECFCGKYEHQMKCSCYLNKGVMVNAGRCLTCNHSKCNDRNFDWIVCFRCEDVCHKGHDIENVGEIEGTECLCGKVGALVSCYLKK
jgi:hypothetical protein